jgi:trans-aconitate 2-methyltransferase
VIARDWDAQLYDTISDKQLGWGLAVLDRIELRGDERVLDAGCGTGKVTAAIAARVPNGHVIGVDASPSMLEEARSRLGPGVELIVSDLLELDLEEPADVVFSNATFHWIEDHELLFRRLYAALRPGGRLEAQCGGKGNVAELVEALRGAARSARFAGRVRNVRPPWWFRSEEETAAALGRAGFRDVHCWTERKAERYDEPTDLYAFGGQYLERLPEELRRDFVTAVMDRMDDPNTREYVRLNIQSRRPPG